MGGHRPVRKEVPTTMFTDLTWMAYRPLPRAPDRQPDMGERMGDPRERRETGGRGGRQGGEEGDRGEMW